MHTVELLEQALTLARELGFGIRQEWFGGDGGGICRIRDQAWIFLDLAESHRDQLAIVLEAIESAEGRATIRLPSAIEAMLRDRAA